MKIVSTIEARMTSKRLPGKVLFEAAGKPMLLHLINRLKVVSSIDEIVLATTTNSSDDILEEFARYHGVSCFRGSEDNVLSRVINAAESVGADVVVEITGDCPIIDPEIVEQIIRIYSANNCDYVGNHIVRSYPDGMDTQVFSLSTLKDAASRTNDSLDQEHVALFLRSHPELYSHLHVVAPPEVHWPELGLTLDELKDFQLLKVIIEHFSSINELFSCREIIEFLRKNPDLVEINKSVQRKGDT
jgi:spore coat polysaccharide biosynthesis protein SpsF